MINLKVLSTAAALALVLPLAVPTVSFAQGAGAYVRPGAGGGGRPGGGAIGGGGGHWAGGGGGGWHGGGGGWHGGGGGWHGGGWHRGGGGFWPGAVAGAVIGGAIASSAYGPGYYGPGYYDGGYGYYDDSAPVVVEAAPDGDASYCAQRYKSYDPSSGTFLGYDGLRHPCP